MDSDRQRIDRWLWHARVVRSRQAAAALAASGRVRVNGQRVDAASRTVRPGDVVTVTLDHSVRVLKVLGFAERRGSAEDARILCEVMEDGRQLPTLADVTTRRDPGAGRPTKRARRDIDRFTGNDGR